MRGFELAFVSSFFIVVITTKNKKNMLLSLSNKLCYTISTSYLGTFFILQPHPIFFGCFLFPLKRTYQQIEVITTLYNIY